MKHRSDAGEYYRIERQLDERPRHRAHQKAYSLHFRGAGHDGNERHAGH